MGDVAMKQLKYTLIELLAAMTIFIIMMGILFNVFSTGAGIMAAESTKVGILADAGVFYNYISNDARSMVVEIIPSPEVEGGSKVGTDYEESSLTFTATTLKFASNVEAYSAVQAAIGANPPYVEYRFDSTSGIIYRKMSNYKDAAAAAAAADTLVENEGEILEGVKAFDIKVWDDYPGGTEITSSPAHSKPACITVSVTMTDPNPDMAQELKDRNVRTITKTLYMSK